MFAVFRFGPKSTVKKYWQNLNLAVAPQVCLSRHIAVSCLRYFNKAIHELANLQVINDSVLALHVQLRRGASGGAKHTTACIMSLRVACKLILADFNLAVSTPTAKFNSPSIQSIENLIFTLYHNPGAYGDKLMMMYHNPVVINLMTMTEIQQLYKECR